MINNKPDSFLGLLLLFYIRKDKVNVACLSLPTTIDSSFFTYPSQGVHIHIHWIVSFVFYSHFSLNMKSVAF